MMVIGKNEWTEEYEYNTGTRIAITLGFNMSKIMYQSEIIDIKKETHDTNRYFNKIKDVDKV